MNAFHNRPPVIVVGRSTTALSVQRLVASLGHPLHAACPRNSWSATTKHYRPLPSTFLGRWRGELGETGIAHLRALPFERAILIPSADDDALWLSQLPADLKERYLTCCAPADAMHLLQDKGEFARLAQSHDIPCPLSVPVTTRRELLEFPLEGDGDYFFKPFDSQSFRRRYGAAPSAFRS